MIYIGYYESTLGILKANADENGLSALQFVDEKTPIDDAPIEREDYNHPIIRQTMEWLDAYFNHKPLPQLPKLMLLGSSFQKTVLKLLLDIEYGKTVTYKDIVKQYCELTGRDKMSNRAIGKAISHNLILIMIPCHRVIHSDGSIGGYSAGVDRKIKLLNHEIV